MAEEPKADLAGEVWVVVGAIAALVAVWWLVGGPSRADLRGMFLQPPPPVGGGEAYGPRPFNTETSSYDYRSGTAEFQSGTSTYQR